MKDSTPTSKQIRRNYSSLMNTWEWRSFRHEVIAYHGPTCWLCCHEDAEGNPLQIHHLKYKNGKLPWEYPMEDVRVYCRTCHETVTRCADDIWNECQGLMPHQLESILKLIKHRELQVLAIPES